MTRNSVYLYNLIKALTLNW